jgi:hypothetical protein
LPAAATINGLFGNVMKRINLIAPHRVTTYYTALRVLAIARNCQFDKNGAC